MPGHIKLVKGAVDPDPTEFLWPSMDMKKEDQNKVSSSLVFLYRVFFLLVPPRKVWNWGHPIEKND